MLNRQDLARLLVTGLCSFSIACSADVAGSGDGFDPEALTPAQLAGPERPLGAADPYAQAAATWGVPQDLLVAIAMTETRMQSVVGEEEFPGMPAAFGVMAARCNRRATSRWWCVSRTMGTTPNPRSTPRAGN